jgi:hypothetical protein
MRVAEGVARYWDTRCARGRSWFPCFTLGGLAHPRASFFLFVAAYLTSSPENSSRPLAPS